MDDIEIMRRIHDLVEEEHHLEGSAEGIKPSEAARLRQVEVALDQCWDLLRQRRARRHSGGDPDTASARPESIVEGYLQ